MYNLYKNHISKYYVPVVLFRGKKAELRKRFRTGTQADKYSERAQKKLGGL